MLPASTPVVDQVKGGVLLGPAPLVGRHPNQIGASHAQGGDIGGVHLQLIPAEPGTAGIDRRIIATGLPLENAAAHPLHFRVTLAGPGLLPRTLLFMFFSAFFTCL